MIVDKTVQATLLALCWLHGTGRWCVLDSGLISVDWNWRSTRTKMVCYMLRPLDYGSSCRLYSSRACWL